jgi:hypothetical protein
MNLAFDQDFYIGIEIKKLCDQFKVKTIVETGTYLGATTPTLAKMASDIHTIEINPEYFAQVHFDLPNIQKYLGNSPFVLKQILPEMPKPCLFYLDAHWNEYWPILDELKTIGQYAKDSIIIIHDFWVPERPELGFDSYKGQKLDYEYIQALLPEIYPDGFSFYYNSIATGGNRGVIYIFPKQE